MDEFHRKIVKSKGHRTTTDKKKIRDIERLLAKEGIPQEIKDKKLADLKVLKKDAKSKARRASFKARHAKNIKKGKMSAAYWADKVKW